VDFPVVSKSSFLIPVLPLKGTQAAHGDLKQWRTARGMAATSFSLKDCAEQDTLLC